MGKIKFDLETKIQACKEYEKGNKSFIEIAKEINAGDTTVASWYVKYKEKGEEALKSRTSYGSFSKEFKMKIVQDYLTGNYSYQQLGHKYNISHSTAGKWVNMWYNGITLKDTKEIREESSMKAKETTYEERLEIVKWVLDNNKNYNKAAEKFNLNYALVYKWTQSFLKEGEEGLKYKKRGPKFKAEIDESKLTDTEKLKLELEKEKEIRKRLELELEVLKKKEAMEKQLYTQNYVKKLSTLRSTSSKKKDAK